MNTEIEYVVHRLNSTVCRITKFIDSEPQLRSSYEVSDTNCQCWQARRGQCRHMVMRRWWFQTKLYPHSVVICYEKKWIAKVEHEAV